MTQYITPGEMHFVTGTWTDAAGQVAGTICKHVAAADESTVINIPIAIPSNSVDLQGSKVVSVEIDYEILVAACDAVDATINKVTRGADGAVAVVSAVTFDYDTGHDTAGERLDVDQHKMTLTLTTPEWLDNDEYLLVVLTCNKAATTTMDILGAFVNFVARD
jgi:hypothetical protein